MKGRLTVHVYSDRYRAVQLMLGADWTDVLSTSRRHQATNRTQDQHRDYIRLLSIYRYSSVMHLRTNIFSLILISQLVTRTVGDSLETTDDAEFSKLIKEEKYVVALFCPSEQEERCEEYESELASAREDLIDVMEGDGWVIKLVDSKELEKFIVGKTDKPVVVMFRSGLPVIYNGILVFNVIQ